LANLIVKNAVLAKLANSQMGVGQKVSRSFRVCKKDSFLYDG